jgi:hypothetical protein
MLGFANLMLDCWLKVSLHPEGPATSQLDQGFPWFFLAPEQMLSWHQNSTLHCMLPMQSSSQLVISSEKLLLLVVDCLARGHSAMNCKFLIISVV